MGFWNKEEEGAASVADEKDADRKSAGATSKTPQPKKVASKASSGSSTDSVRSALGKGTVIQGKLSFDTPVRIDGKLGGEVFSTDTLIVGADGRVDAQIKVKNLIVLGTVKGSVVATGRVELQGGSSLEGNISAPSIVIEETANFNGKCEMHRGEPTSKAAPVASTRITKKGDKSAISSKSSNGQVSTQTEIVPTKDGEEASLH